MLMWEQRQNGQWKERFRRLYTEGRKQISNRSVYSNSENKVLSILLLKELTHENNCVPSLINKYRVE